MAEILYGDKAWKQILNETLSSIAHLCETKGSEYAASNKDQLANFRRRADRFEMPMEAAWAIYAGKHWDAIETYITDLIHKRERPRSEPMEGRCDDLIVYLILLKAMLAERGHAKLDYCISCDREQPLSGCDDPNCQRAKKLKPYEIKPICKVCGAIVIEQTFGCTRAICPVVRTAPAICSVCSEPFVAACDNDKCPHHQAGF